MHTFLLLPPFLRDGALVVFCLLFPSHLLVLIPSLSNFPYQEKAVYKTKSPNPESIYTMQSLKCRYNRPFFPTTPEFCMFRSTKQVLLLHIYPQYLLQKIRPARCCCTGLNTTTCRIHPPPSSSSGFSQPSSPSSPPVRGSRPLLMVSQPPCPSSSSFSQSSQL